MSCAYASKSCETLANGPTLQFVDEPGNVVETQNTKPLSCQRIFECNVLTSPPEATVFWYKNNKIVHATVTRDLTLSSPYHDNTGVVLGVSELRHRICVDSLMDGNDPKPFDIKCRIQSSCDPRKIIESNSIVIEPQILRTKKSFANNFYRAPLISLISSSRMEIAGKFVQLYCNAIGNPKPEISWQIIDNEDENLVYDIENYPFIWTLSNGNLLIDTTKTQEASITLQCIAQNKFGIDNATSSLILLNDNEK
uniref:Ig-like domain-containing protein n=1 Tax=Panagrolaimus sp. PS1159 TaxID=55785 RepID=A0AC35F7B8_9BILA